MSSVTAASAKEISEPDAADNTVRIDMPVTFHQSEGRAMLDLVNQFRTGPDAWAWEPGNTSKRYYYGAELIYDYGLEAVATQRAVELIARFSHTRPDGMSWTETYSDLGYRANDNAENIAYFYGLSAKGAVEMFREDDDGYSGQGHRRSMLEEKYKYMGCGCIQYENKYFYVQEFSTKPLDQTWTEPKDYDWWASAHFKRDSITDWKMEYDKIEVNPGTSGKVYDLNKSMFQFGEKYYKCGWDLPWTSDDTTIASVYDKTYYSAEKIGTTVFRAPAGIGSQTLSFELKVRSLYRLNYFDWASDYKSASVYLNNSKTHEEIKLNAVVSETVTKEPTCTSVGEKKVTASVEYEEETYSEEKTVRIPAIGHKWGKASYTWNGKECTASATCLNDSSETEKQTVTASVRVRQSATCITKGIEEYTAKFSYPFSIQTRTVELPFGNHTVYNASYQWALDYSTCTATGTCKTCGKK
ncbi:MAG: CAP domain-containing protein [Solobacterium sp.]|nr:CAP domain-containing protein [Solobacterium sp.]